MSLDKKFDMVVFSLPQGRSKDIHSLLNLLGRFRRFPMHRIFPLRFYSEGWEVAREAFVRNQFKLHASPVMRALSILKYYLVYSSVRFYFSSNPHLKAVLWNGLGGKKRIIAKAVEHAGASCLYMELAPFENRLTIDQKGVNFANSLPRDIEPYLNWAKKAGVRDDAWRSLAQKPVQRSACLEFSHLRSADTPDIKESKYIFVPLQVPNDSQVYLFGGQFKRIEDFVSAILSASSYLPEGWHIRLKEHPSSTQSLFRDLSDMLSERPVYIDNASDSFEQVKHSQAVMTMNSSVGLEAMLFDKLVVVCSECFWALEGVAETANTLEEMQKVFANIDSLSFQSAHRNAFLNFLFHVYYPDIRDMSDRAGQRLRVRLGHEANRAAWIEDLPSL